jgi:TP901 family phage tail tape measure protein
MPAVIDTAFVEIFPQFRDFAGQVQREVDGAARGISAGVSQSLEQAGAKLTSAGQQLSQVGGNLTRSVTLPLVGIAVASFKTAADFESSMAKIVGLVGIPREQIQAWEGDVRSLAIEFGKSGGEAADALYFITSAGLEGDVAMQALEQSLKASAVGLGETAVIADLTTSAINAYGSNVLSAADATDILVAAVREGKVEPDQLAGAMGRVLPVASAMGVSFDQVGAAFAAMSRTGTNANEAATQLRGILNGLLNPSAQARDQLDELGLSAQGLRDQIREEGLLATLETLTAAFGDNEEAQALVFGNVRALSGVMDLMGANSATTAEIFAELTDSTGALDAAFEETSDTAQFQLNQVLAELKDLLLEIGQSLLPIVVDALSRVRDVISRLRTAWEGLSDSQRELIIRIAGIAAAIGPLLVGLGTLLATFGGMITLIGRLAPLFAALTGPVGIVIAVIGLLAAAFLAADGDISGFADNMVNSITGIVEKISERLPVIIPQVVTFLIDLIDTLATTLTTLLPVVVSAAVELFQGLVDGLVQVLPVLLDAAITTVQSVATTVAENLRYSSSPGSTYSPRSSTGCWRRCRS